MTPRMEDNKDRLDLGNGVAATVYTDGSVVFWNIMPPHEQVAYIPPGSTDPVVVGPDQAATLAPDGSVVTYPISNPPPEYAGTIPAGGPPGATPAPAANPRAPTGPVGTGRPGEDFNYGPTRPGTGRYPGAIPGQTVRPGDPGKMAGIPFGSTVAPSTWNPASPGRGEGWGTIGAGTEGQPYGWGVPGFNQAPIAINPNDLPHLFNEKVAPGYIPGSGTYNQFRLDTQNQTPRFPGAPQGLFATMPLRQGGSEVVNTRFGLGGTGDPTTGGEMQTPERWITGVPTASTQPMQGDAKWRATGGTFRGGGGGGFDPADAPAYSYPTPSKGEGVGGGGMGGGFFGSTVTSNWGQTAETAGKDYIATLFLRSDTPTGIGTPAWSAPQSMWDGLAQEIAAGRITITDPQAWAMLAQKGYTPQNIGGAASGPQNVPPGGAARGTTEDAIANANAAAAADRAAYWAYQQAMIRQGDTRLAQEAARDAWTQTYQSAGLTGQFGGQDTMAMQQQKYAQDLANRQFGLSESGVTGTYQGQKTQQAIAQENAAAQALLQLQSSMRGPRNWDAYQTTFNSTPQGLKDVMGSFAGRYALPGAAGANGQAQGGRATVAGAAGDILSGTYGANAGGTPEALGNPYQADVRNWSRMQPSQREMVLGKYENQGWYGDDFTNMLNTAAPKYAGATGGNYSLFK